MGNQKVSMSMGRIRKAVAGASKTLWEKLPMAETSVQCGSTTYPLYPTSPSSIGIGIEASIDSSVTSVVAK